MVKLIDGVGKDGGCYKAGADLFGFETFGLYLVAMWLLCINYARLCHDTLPL